MKCIVNSAILPRYQREQVYVLHGRNPLQCIHMSNLPDVHFKYLTVLFINCTSAMLEKIDGVQEVVDF